MTLSVHVERYIFQGTAWMSGLGKSGERPDHIEESLHRAASSARDVSHLQWTPNKLCRARSVDPSVCGFPKARTNFYSMLSAIIILDSI